MLGAVADVPVGFEDGGVVKDQVVVRDPALKARIFPFSFSLFFSL